MIGVISGWLWILFRKLKANSYLSLIITGFVGSMVNTIFVMGSIYLLFAGQYAAAKDVARTAVFGLIMGTVTASGIPEAIAAAILVTVITKALLKVVPNLSNASAIFFILSVTEPAAKTSVLFKNFFVKFSCRKVF